MLTTADNPSVPLNTAYIRTRREQLKLTQAAAAKAARIPGGRQRWNDIESGRFANPRLDTLLDIARALRCPVAKLIRR